MFGWIYCGVALVCFWGCVEFATGQFYIPAASQAPNYYHPVERPIWIPLRHKYASPPLQIVYPVPQTSFAPGETFYINPNLGQLGVPVLGAPAGEQFIVGEIVKTPAGQSTQDNKVTPKKTLNGQSGMSDPGVSSLDDKPDDGGAQEAPKVAQQADPSTAEEQADTVEVKPQAATKSRSETEQEGPASASLAGQSDAGANSDIASADIASPIRSDTFMKPLGPIASDQKRHLFWVIVLTLIAVMPVFLLLPLILFRYRRGSKKDGIYQPKWDSSVPLELLMWGVPVVLVVFMSARLWHSTHLLDPYAEIPSRNDSVNVQVVGLDWKWLFIYPDHGIATVGELTIPVDHPASMTLTTDTVMQSFVIPALGGQIYAMPGMTTELNLIADQLGTSEGENTQFNGDGFSGQKFMTNVVPVEEFEAWVEKVKQQSVPLDAASYKILARRTDQSKAIADLRTEGMPESAIYFTLDDKMFFEKILMRYMNHKPLDADQQPGSPTYGVAKETGGEVTQ